MVVQLPINNSVSNFVNNYFAYTTTYYLDKVTYAGGFGYFLDNGTGNGIKGKLINGNTIQFSPFTLNDSNIYWFNYVGGQYVPQKWVNCNLYQERNSNLLNNFNFQANVNTNTLHTVYGDNYTIIAFIRAFDSNYNSLRSVQTTNNISGNFSIDLDTTDLPTIAHVRWGFQMDGYPVYITETNNQGSVNINDTLPCFKEDTKILTDSGYKLVQDLRKGDLVKTLLHGHMPVYAIGKREIHHHASKERTKDQLYTCKKDAYTEVFEDLVLTGCHSILVDEFKEGEREKTIEVLTRVFVTDKKYRLPACVDERATVHETPGTYTIYHFALEHEDKLMNYGVYANGLLVETCSKRYITELSNMELIE